MSGKAAAGRPPDHDAAHVLPHGCLEHGFGTPLTNTPSILPGRVTELRLRYMVSLQFQGTLWPAPARFPPLGTSLRADRTMACNTWPHPAPCLQAWGVSEAKPW